MYKLEIFHNKKANKLPELAFFQTLTKLVILIMSLHGFLPFLNPYRVPYLYHLFFTITVKSACMYFHTERTTEIVLAVKEFIIFPLLNPRNSFNNPIYQIPTVGQILYLMHRYKHQLSSLKELKMW